MGTVLSLDISIRSDSGATDLRDVHELLADADALRGAVHIVPGEPVPNSLGWPETLAVALGSGGAISTLVALLGVWLRQRSYDVRVTLRDKAGTVIAELDAVRVRDPRVLQDLAATLTTLTEANVRSVTQPTLPSE